MPGFNYDSSIADLIDKELKKFNDEDMLWIYDKLLIFVDKNQYSFHSETDSLLIGKQINFKFDDFNNIKEITKKIKSRLEKIGEIEEVEYFFKRIQKFNNFDKELFSFLKTNKRLCNFAINFIENNSLENRNNLPEFKFIENNYLYTIYQFTFNEINFNKDSINKVKAIFIDVISKDYHNNSKNFEDEDFLKWAYSYLINKSRDFKRLKYRPSTNSDYYNLIVSFLDYILHFKKDTHYSLTNQLYKAWSQKKFRAADKVKKQYHLPLTKGAKSELKKLSDFKNKTENEILEELIHQMYLKEMCDEDGKLKY
ncbi:hypothetical protein [Acinetobacter nematophilus]|uniref:Uncharacterized protein n=1 Tax=Acinetobacter nematophilus TaxID=2994642 RepID=A0A9X3DW46_9GAMM|nr:hypothetical protein [Acinetobacter nematophilus]MCX5469564.1 hypothetical protein [Acinetobacter nematophilus]